MRSLLTLVPLALLAACGGAASNKAAGAANTTTAVNPARAGEIQECIADVANELPAGADANAFCGCAVDRMQAAGGERAAMEACAAEMGIQPRS